MNQSTSRNISKSVQLKKLKEKLHVAGSERSHKKINMVKALKNLKKREQRKWDSLTILIKILNGLAAVYIKVTIG